MYRAIDQDADGKWDVAQKFDVDTEKLSTINLDDLEDVNTGVLTMFDAEQLFD